MNGSSPLKDEEIQPDAEYRRNPPTNTGDEPYDPYHPGPWADPYYEPPSVGDPPVSPNENDPPTPGNPGGPPSTPFGGGTTPQTPQGGSGRPRFLTDVHTNVDTTDVSGTQASSDVTSTADNTGSAGITSAAGSTGGAGIDQNGPEVTNPQTVPAALNDDGRNRILITINNHNEVGRVWNTQTCGCCGRESLSERPDDQVRAIITTSEDPRNTPKTPTARSCVSFALIPLLSELLHSAIALLLYYDEVREPDVGFLLLIGLAIALFTGYVPLSGMWASRRGWAAAIGAFMLYRLICL